MIHVNLGFLQFYNRLWGKNRNIFFLFHNDNNNTNKNNNNGNNNDNHRRSLGEALKSPLASDHSATLFSHIIGRSSEEVEKNESFQGQFSRFIRATLCRDT